MQSEYGYITINGAALPSPLLLS